MYRFIGILTLLAVSLIQALAADAPLGASPDARGGAPAFRGVESAVEDGLRLERLAPIAAEDAGTFVEGPDGTRYLTLRFQGPGATALRLHIRNMRLPEGARLFVYGVDESGQVTDVAGPYTGSGPGLDSEFRTAAVRGAEIVAELQAGEEPIADLPFEVTALSWADETSVPEAGRGRREVKTSLYQGVPLRYEIGPDGLAIFEGDIVLGSVGELEQIQSAKRKADRSSLGILGSAYRWPGGTIPYAIGSTIPSQTRITDAVAHWNTTLAGTVKLIPRTTETAYILFTRATDASQCSSYVGRQGNAQTLWIGDSCGTGNMIHEIGHAFGLWHEQGRADRNTYVKINYANIISTATANFDQNITNGIDINSYDYGSIMHYPAYAFSVNGLPTIETIPSGIAIGQRSGLSAGDIGGIRYLYPSATPPPSTTTATVSLSTNPTGLPFTADSVQYSTAQSLKWVVGSSHPIAAVNPAPANGTRYLWANWTDGGAQAHSVTVPSAGLTLKANYSTAYSVTATASGPGAVTMSPLSADTYYAPNTVLSLKAAASAGACFTGWTGLIAGTPASTTLTVTKAYALVAKFQTGTVGASPATLSFSATGGTLSISVTATSGCPWAASTAASWLKLGSTSGTASASLKLTASKNTGAARTGTVVVNGITINISQAGAK